MRHRSVTFAEYAVVHLPGGDRQAGTKMPNRAFTVIFVTRMADLGCCPLASGLLPFISSLPRE